MNRSRETETQKGENVPCGGGWGGAAGGETISSLGEFGLIEALTRQLAKGSAPSSGLRLGIGDDTCVFAPSAGWELLATCDSLVEGRHFLPARCSPEDVGHRAAAVNLSDVAAMGGEPRLALVSLGLRPGTPVAGVAALYRGLMAEFAPLGVTVAGGNCTAVDGPCFVDVTLLGEVEAGRAVRRNGARPGDAVLITGYPGVGAAGLAVLQGGVDGPEFPALCAAYRRPCHRAREGRALGRSGLAHAMIDVSDGLPGDLGHLARASGVGVSVQPGRLPRHREVTAAAAHLGVDPLAWVLGPSDDYELLFTCAPEDEAAATAAVGAVSGVSVTRIGAVVEEAGVWLQNSQGARRPLAGGWDHFSTSG